MAKTKTAPAAGKRTSPADTRPSTKPATVDQAILQAQRGKVSVSTERAIEMAGTLYAQGRYDQAEKVCRQLLRARPNNADAHNILGVALNGQGRADEAVEILRKAIAL